MSWRLLRPAAILFVLCAGFSSNARAQTAPVFEMLMTNHGCVYDPSRPEVLLGVGLDAGVFQRWEINLGGYKDMCPDEGYLFYWGPTLWVWGPKEVNSFGISAALDLSYTPLANTTLDDLSQWHLYLRPEAVYRRLLGGTQRPDGTWTGWIYLDVRGGYFKARSPYVMVGLGIGRF